MRIPSYSSLIMLILANLFILAQYFYFGWSDGEIMLLFWIESAIVGFYTILKMMIVTLSASPQDIQIGRWPGSTRIKKEDIKSASLLIYKIGSLFLLIPFFIFHFGTFMAAHLIFIVFGFMDDFSLSLLLTLLISTIPLFLSHGFSFVSNFLLKKEYHGTQPPNIMLAPYKRVVIMHITIIFGVMLSAPAILLFIGKIIADAYSHLKEHGIVQKGL